MDFWVIEKPGHAPSMGQGGTREVCLVPSEATLCLTPRSMLGLRPVVTGLRPIIFVDEPEVCQR